MFGMRTGSRQLHRSKRMAAAAILATLSFGCASQPQSGTFTGRAGNATAGVANGSSDNNAGKGALIGGSVGLIGGGLEKPAVADKPEREERLDRARAESRHVEEPRRQILTDARDTPGRVTREDVVAWTRQGRTDEVIIDRIERGDDVFRPNAVDEDRLRNEGVTDNVLRALRQTGRR